MAAIIASLITGACSIVVVLIANRRSQAAIAAELEKHQAVTDTKLEELTREVREHNDFARRVPVIEEQVKVINHRLSDLEEYYK